MSKKRRMRDHSSKLIFIGILLIPFLFVTVTAFYGGAVPLEGEVISDIRFLESSENSLEIVFFGYVGCSFICPTSLFKVGEVLDASKKEYPEAKIGGFFVDINAKTQIERVHSYSLNFSEHIEGINVNEYSLNEMRKSFGLTVIDTNREVDEIIHTDYFFLLKKVAQDWVVARVLENKSEQIIIKQAIEQEIASLPF